MKEHATGPWIKTSEQLPEPGVNVLGVVEFNEYGKEPIIVRLTDSKKRWKENDSVVSWRLDAIAQWAEISLPEPEENQ